MAFDYEALVGHLYVVNGRNISATPPGALVEVAPRKAVRGREMDTFFALVLPAGEAVAAASFYEKMAQLAAEHYFDSTGGVTSGVRTLFSTLNQNLYEHNQSGKRPYEVSMVCAVLHGNDIFLARVGAAAAVLHHEGTTEVFPVDYASPSVLYGDPLGRNPVPDVKMTRYRIVSGTRMVMGDTGLIEIPLPNIENAANATDIAAMIVLLREQVQVSAIYQLVEFVPPDVPAAVPVLEAEATNRVNQIIATEAAPAPESPSKVTTAATDVRHQLQRGASGAAIKIADGLDAVHTGVEKLSTRTQGRRLPFGDSSAVIILVPVALVLLVLFMWLGGTGESEFEICVNEAQRAADLARSIDSGDVNGTLAAWNAVLLTIERCNEIRPGDEQLATLTREGQDIIDRLYYIERRDPLVIEAFPNARLTQAVLRGDDLYVLDDNNDQVYRVTLAADGLSAVPNSRQPIPTMRRNAQVSSFTLGDIVALTWADQTNGLSQNNVLIGLDRNGVLVEYSPTFLARGVQRLLGSETWVDPIRMQIWENGSLYILDPGANQIWRYDPSGGSFPGAPLEYFTGQTRPALQNAVDFAIDANGRIYILFADGVITLFSRGEQLPFGFASFPTGQQINTTDALYLNTSPIAPGIYLISRADRTVYETSLAGTFINSYRAYDETLFEGLANVVADDNRNVIYVLSGNSILAFPG